MAHSSERLDHLLSRLGYCSRSEARDLLREGRVSVDGMPLRKAATKVDPATVQIDEEPLDHPYPLYVLYHKPLGKVCAHDDPRAIYQDFPPRWRYRRPSFSSVGRLDRETSGVLLLTDDGDWLHRWTSPRYEIPRQYRVTLQNPLQGHEVGILASGTLLLEGEHSSCKAAEMIPLGTTELQLTLHEGRYHEVRRMFAALDNLVLSLHREAFGPFTLDDLAPGQWRELSEIERQMES
ncbi:MULTISPECIES: pseudouridine synthase [Acidithiobacillus]|uniref:pseudouridine synthase n=1 Tax=Acidithiobacillus TaxID=119977 RepID=UPI00187A3BEC|nr:MULTISPECIES: pseudouridine synthase [Acidithiobacillus]MBE7565775.1 rRNA pseudouridine synthase [Acidithiobacillus sp. HP-11]MBU2792399.1 rRNA pseudouridine synthase [Acidithiobacillus thiooxidans]